MATQIQKRGMAGSRHAVHSRGCVLDDTAVSDYNCDECGTPIRYGNPDWKQLYDAQALLRELDALHIRLCEAVTAERDKFKEALRTIAYTGSSCPLGMEESYFCRLTMNDCIKTAARALEDTNQPPGVQTDE